MTTTPQDLPPLSVREVASGDLAGLLGGERAGTQPEQARGGTLKP